MREQSGTRAAPPPPGRPRPGLPRPAAPPCSPLRCSGSVFRFVCSWVVLTPGYDFTCVPFNLSFYRWRHGHVLSRLEILTPAPGERTLESRSPLACPTSSPPVTGRLRSGGASNRQCPRPPRLQGPGERYHPDPRFPSAPRPCATRWSARLRSWRLARCGSHRCCPRPCCPHPTRRKCPSAPPD